MNVNQTTRCNVWDMYSKGFTQKQIQMNLALKDSYVEQIIKDFIKAEELVNDDRIKRVTKVLMEKASNTQPDFVLYTVNPELLILKEKLGI